MDKTGGMADVSGKDVTVRIAKAGGRWYSKEYTDNQSAGQT